MSSSVVESFLLQEHSCEDNSFPVSNADTFVKHKKRCLHGVQATCEKVSLPMEHLDTTVTCVNGQKNHSNINHLNFKTKYNYTFFSFDANYLLSSNGDRYRFWENQISVSMTYQ